MLKKHMLYMPLPASTRTKMGGPRPVAFDVLITTPEMLVQDETFLASLVAAPPGKRKVARACGWGAVCVDEAHRMKNRKSRLSVALRSMHAETRLLLTGTPLQVCMRRCAFIMLEHGLETVQALVLK